MTTPAPGLRKGTILALPLLVLEANAVIETPPSDMIAPFTKSSWPPVPEKILVPIESALIWPVRSTSVAELMAGEPTPVDFSSEIVLAVVNPVTDVATELKPVSLVKEGKCLVLTCKKITGDKQSWSIQPVLLVKVDRSYDPGAAKVKIE